MSIGIPSINDISANHKNLSHYINITPVLSWDDHFKDVYLGKNTHVVYKCELLQKSGIFKLRGALTFMLSLTQEQKEQGVVAGTGGNHGVAVAYAAKLLSVDAKVIVPKNMNKLRHEKIKSLGADILTVKSITDVLNVMEDIAEKEGRITVHPYEHPKITLGTATLGYEFLQQVPDLDILLVSVGGGGLASGVACAAKQINPNIKVFGIEPEKANSMSLSFQQNKPLMLKQGSSSIADSLNAPGALPYSFQVCKKFIDDIVLISDDEMRHSMKLLFEYLNLVCEPACAATTAALLGPLKVECQNKRVGLILCGSNIDIETFSKLTKSSQVCVLNS